jgi:hypothetical protein
VNSFQKQLERRAVAITSSEGIDWNALYKNAKQIIVFGSYASGVNKPTSDLDLLCIGYGRRYKSPKLHLIWVTEQQSNDPAWCSGELAGHVSKYGKWIKGKNLWECSCNASKEIIDRKRRRVLNRASTIQDEWKNLLSVFRSKQLTRLRRDLQRLDYLKRGQAIPPGPTLDNTWTGDWNPLFVDEPFIQDAIVPLLRKAFRSARASKMRVEPERKNKISRLRKRK